MTTSELIRGRMVQLRISFNQLLDKLGCGEKTLRRYMDGTSTSGRYVVPLMESLRITLEEWMACINVES